MSSTLPWRKRGPRRAYMMGGGCAHKAHRACFQLIPVSMTAERLPTSMLQSHKAEQVQTGGAPADEDAGCEVLVHERAYRGRGVTQTVVLGCMRDFLSYALSLSHSPPLRK